MHYTAGVASVLPMNFTTILDHVLDRALGVLPSATPVGIQSLAGLERAFRRLPAPALMLDVPGWLTSREERALYYAGLCLPGPFLEIGPWLGRSTVLLARGIQDSSVPKRFVTYELAPTPANFRPMGADRVGFFYPPESPVSMGSCAREVYERDIDPAVSHPKGVAGLLQDNLIRYGVARDVIVRVGDFRSSPVEQAGFVFADCMHDTVEIERNLPDLKVRIRPGGVLACHDTTPENELLLRGNLDLACSFRVDSLFFGQLAR